MKLAQVAINNHFVLFVANSMLSFRFLNVPFIKKGEVYPRTLVDSQQFGWEVSPVLLQFLRVPSRHAFCSACSCKDY